MERRLNTGRLVRGHPWPPTAQSSGQTRQGQDPRGVSSARCVRWFVGVKVFLNTCVNPRRSAFVAFQTLPPRSPGYSQLWQFLGRTTQSKEARWRQESASAPLVSAECVRSVLCCAVVSVTTEHGQKQKVGGGHGNVERDRILPPPQRGAREGSIREEHHSNRTGRVSQGPGNSGVAQPPQRLSPDERVSEARARVLVWKPRCRCSGRTVPRVHQSRKH